jgi:maltose alpha-D-glucosyltransferase / alpha-amylase
MPNPSRNREGLDRDPTWYKSGVIYELHVRGYFDSDADGTGDFRGLTEKLDYIKDLGVTAVWLLPFYPSPLRDDGYDIADYCAVHPRYGTLGDFSTFLREAHRRSLRVITELVLNHTSDQHPWFQRARRARPSSRWRKFYVWSDTMNRYQDARIIFKDVEVSNWSWDNVAQAYYWHRFFSHQPDLNYDHPEVRAAMIKAVDFWLDRGVDGLRLDAVPYLYEREGTNCENLPETHAFLKELRAHVDAKYGDRMLLAEANQWPEEAVTYFGSGRGDECHMAFHFPLMPRLFMALRMEERLPIVDILEQTPPIPESSQWALFLRNHDELTLEMVTDEERDYMYRMYARVHQARLNLGIRRRLAPLLGNDRRRIELLNGLLLSLPGTPVLYYGDEIGLGENVYLGDRNGVRTPMQWNSDKNAGFSRANPQSLYLPIILDPEYHYEAVNVEAQVANPHSLLWWMRRCLALRKRWRALGEGKCEFLQPENRKILSYLLRFQEETLLVVANLSRFVQPVELDLAALKDRVPIELFGRLEFPAITDRPYPLTLGPHAFYWFSIEPKSAGPGTGSHPRGAGSSAVLIAQESWQEVLFGKARTHLEAVLADYLISQPWFGRKSSPTRLVTIKQTIPIPVAGGGAAFLAFLQVDYVGTEAEMYLIPIAFASGVEANGVRLHSPQFVLADINLQGRGQTGILYEALANPAFCRSLVELISQRHHLKGAYGELEPTRAPALRQILGESATLEPTLSRGRQRNSSLVYGDKLILKLFRRLDPGLNPELELGRFLTERGFRHSAPLAGAIELTGAQQPPLTLAVLSGLIPNAKNALDYALDALGRYYDRVRTWVGQEQTPPAAAAEPLKLLQKDIPPAIAESIGSFVESARLLGARTADLHLALASAPEGDDLAPEAFAPHYQRSLFQSMRNQAVRNLRALRKQLPNLDGDCSLMAQQATDLEPAILQSYRALYERRIKALRIRIHGDCRLEQVLWTGKDFVFIDFEGDPTTALSERRIKQSPLRDVAGLARSFHHAAYVGLHQQVERGNIPPEHLLRFESWMKHWNRWVTLAFLNAYLQGVEKSGLLPGTEAELQAMLRAYLLDQMMYEIGQEMAHPTGSIAVPLRGILHLMGDPPTPRPGPGGSATPGEGLVPG